MTWLRLECTTSASELEPLEATLWDGGAVAISLVSEDDERVLEPAPGETPLWSVVRLHALFDLETDWRVLKDALAALGVHPEVSFVGDDDWVDAARRFAVDETFAGRLRVCPPGALKIDDIEHLYIEPGLAFGSGGHPTTALCLEWLAQNVRGGERVLDYGCGSGILAVAACLLGAESVAVDYDPQALTATRENAARNGIDPARLTTLAPEAFSPGRPFDVVVANILAQPLIDLSQVFASVLRPDGAIVLSGLLEEQSDWVMSAYPEVVFQSPRLNAEWACLVGRRVSPTDGDDQKDDED